jgi:hypothetical protein
MIGAYVVIAAALFLFGAVCGFVVLVSLASHRDKDLDSPAPSRYVRGARVATSLHTRGPGMFQEAAYRHELPRLNDEEWWRR